MTNSGATSIYGLNPHGKDTKKSGKQPRIPLFQRFRIDVFVQQRINTNYGFFVFVVFFLGAIRNEIFKILVKPVQIVQCHCVTAGTICVNYADLNGNGSVRNMIIMVMKNGTGRNINHFIILMYRDFINKFAVFNIWGCYDNINITTNHKIIFFDFGLYAANLECCHDSLYCGAGCPAPVNSIQQP